VSRVFISEGKGAGIYVFSDDCPAHGAEYDPANEQVHVVFDDGTTEHVRL
jgi:hypothetical protein